MPGQGGGHMLSSWQFLALREGLSASAWIGMRIVGGRQETSRIEQMVDLAEQYRVAYPRETSLISLCEQLHLLAGEGVPGGSSGPAGTGPGGTGD